MISARFLLKQLSKRGVSEITGVPCSYLTPVINKVATDPAVRYLRATHEGEAVASATGSWLAGATTCVIAQNSGLGNMVNPLTSLNSPAGIPVPIIVTWRGEPGRPDEPQHELMGEITPDLLSLMRVPNAVLPSAVSEAEEVLRQGWEEMEDNSVPFAFVLRDGTVVAEELNEPPPIRLPAPHKVVKDAPAESPTRFAVLNALLETLPEHAAVISTTGKTSRELFTIADRPQNFYLVGAMGSASAVGLGVSRHTTRPVVVVDGDGAALMRLSTFAAIGSQAGPGLTHVLLDNGVHDSTGGQLSLAAYADFPAIAVACGYRRVYDCGDTGEFMAALQECLRDAGPSLVYMKISPGSLPKLARPDVHPRDVARRFQEFLTNELVAEPSRTS
ncbi:phosphonopyruvate decarboxylase (plasmid) [Streptomyces sp. Qhu-G9]|uniref:phosphonopyruvate decarboxylase n=1 Tax=Streptomyces sp. Qhu-G9 TaxID=3452799 RepID=UPI0022AC6563|nr:phosphonopyruvate decarboxylase [Streptomyces aurantiacus]WAU78281.1 phosphonopyruvate decarboxylase [Streptomyces aurantiacus]